MALEICPNQCRIEVASWSLLVMAWRGDPVVRHFPVVDVPLLWNRAAKVLSSSVKELVIFDFYHCRVRGSGHPSTQPPVSPCFNSWSESSSWTLPPALLSLNLSRCFSFWYVLSPVFILQCGPKSGEVCLVLKYLHREVAIALSAFWELWHTALFRLPSKIQMRLNIV